MDKYSDREETFKAELEKAIKRAEERKQEIEYEIAILRESLSIEQDKQDSAIYISAMRKFKEHAPSVFKDFTAMLEEAPFLMGVAAQYYLIELKIRDNHLAFINEKGNLEVNLNTTSLSSFEKAFIQPDTPE